MTALDAGVIHDLITASGIDGIEQVDVFAEIDSTNTWLGKQPPPAPGCFRVALADHQTAGRGRSLNKWISAPGRSLCLSMSYTFKGRPESLSPLTLALGTGVADTLEELGVDAIRLKWPNDLLAGDAKVGGILTETQYKGRDDIVVIAGLGLNVLLPDRIDDAISSSYVLRAVDLNSLLSELPSREALAVAVIDGWCRTFQNFAEGGFERFQARFAEADWLAGKSVTVSTPEGEIEGLAAGVDETGALRVETSSGSRLIISGSVSKATPA